MDEITTQPSKNKDNKRVVKIHSPMIKASILIQTSRQITEILAFHKLHGFNLLLDDGPAFVSFRVQWNCSLWFISFS